MGPPVHRSGAPSPVLTALEGRALGELGALQLAAPLLRRLPKGDGHPVLVLPGFTAGDPSTSTTACDLPTGYVATSTDCDDGDDAINPDAAEVCNGEDDDCDGTIDDGATDDATWYADDDSDGFGDADSSTESCDAPSGYVADDTDCDDDASGVNPGADEVCDGGTDEDCDGDADDDDASVTGTSDWYADADGDKFGDASSVVQACEAPKDTVADATDCDDTDKKINPDEDEVCDELDVDEDCDGAVDDDDSSVTGQSTWYTDADLDGFGDAGSTTLACDEGAGVSSTGDDCDDDDAALNPETGCEVDWSGTYSGDLELNVDGGFAKDVCTGTGTVTIDVSKSPMITGTMKCSFASTLAILGEQTVTLTGDIEADDSAAGEVDASGFISAEWTGALSGNATLEGETSGSATVAGFPVTYEGTFSLDRE